MFELHQLKQFLAIVDCGTVSKAAEKLNITQPALSRSLQNLEYELKTPLFNRGKNKVTLTPTGQYAAELARKLLTQAEEFQESIREFHRSHSKLIIASCAPCELLFQIRDLCHQHFSQIECETLVEREEEIFQKLSDGSYSMGLFSKKQKNPDFLQLPLKTEELFVMLPENHPLAKEKKISFAQINGEPVIPLPLKGHWTNLIERKLPDSQLLYQADIPSFDQVIHASNLITFQSTLLEFPLENHKKIPLSDPEAKITYYFAILKTNEKQYRDLINELPK